MSLRAKFDAWRAERLDRKLLAIRLRYETDTPYVPYIQKETEAARRKREVRENEEQLISDSALFASGEPNPNGLPAHFKMTDVIGLAAPEFDAAPYAEECAKLFGGFEEQHAKLISSLRNDRGQAYPTSPVVVETWSPDTPGTRSKKEPFVPVKSTNPLQGDN